jgi:hypothetical protein
MPRLLGVFGPSRHPQAIIGGVSSARDDHVTTGQGGHIQKYAYQSVQICCFHWLIVETHLELRWVA